MSLTLTAKVKSMNWYYLKKMVKFIHRTNSINITGHGLIYEIRCASAHRKLQDLAAN